MTPADVIVSPVGQSAIEAKSVLNENKAVKRKAEKIYNPSHVKKARSGNAVHSKRKTLSSNKTKKQKQKQLKKKKKTATKKKTGSRKNKGRRSKKVKVQRTNSIFSRHI